MDARAAGKALIAGIIDLVRAGGRIVDFKVVGKSPDAQQVDHLPKEGLALAGPAMRLLIPPGVSSLRVWPFTALDIFVTDIH